MKDIEMEMEMEFSAENLEMTLAQIRAARSFFGPESSATYLKSLSEEMTLASLSRRKLEMRLSLAHFNRLLPSSNTFQESGKEIAMMNDFWEFHSQE